MDRIQKEAASLDPHVPFRYSTTHQHHTWARTFHSRPELYLRPHSLEEIQKIVTLARRCRRRLVVVGCGHSPSDLTCSSSWMVNLDNYNRVLKIDKQRKTLLVEGGIRLQQLNERANEVGLTIPNLGSIDEQSIVGAISTATHGSSLKHGLLSENVRSLRIVLSNGSAVRCSPEQNPDLFRAATISLGALGIITEVEYQMTDACHIEWQQSLAPLDTVVSTWKTTLWTQKEYTRVWWMPYLKRAIVWSAEKTEKPLRAAPSNFYGGSVGFHTYHNLLWLSNYFPSILPWVEWFVFGMQYGFKPGTTTSAVEPLRTGLLMNCLYSQFVNEWALPLSKGPEAITRLSAWINGEPGSNIPFSAKGLYVHCPIEVRVSDTSSTRKAPRPFLDNTCESEPTLYLNATLYRAYLHDPPCKDRYYEAFEWLMKELGGKPHYAKNFQNVSSEEIGAMFGDNFKKWSKIRAEADPEGMFVGEWHRRVLGIGKAAKLALAEREVSRSKASDGGQSWYGEVDDGGYASRDAVSDVQDRRAGSPSASSTTSSFDLVHGAEAEKSFIFHGDEEDEREDESRYHGDPKRGVFGTQVFDKM